MIGGSKQRYGLEALVSSRPTARGLTDNQWLPNYGTNRAAHPTAIYHKSSPLGLIAILPYCPENAT